MAKDGKFIKFLKDEKALKGLIQICIILFVIIISVGLLILLFKSDTYAQQIVPLITFILGTVLGGIGSHIWGGKKK